MVHMFLILDMMVIIATCDLILKTDVIYLLHLFIHNDCLQLFLYFLIEVNMCLAPDVSAGKLLKDIKNYVSYFISLISII